MKLQLKLKHALICWAVCAGLAAIALPILYSQELTLAFAFPLLLLPVILTAAAIQNTVIEKRLDRLMDTLPKDAVFTSKCTLRSDIIEAAGVVGISPSEVTLIPIMGKPIVVPLDDIDEVEEAQVMSKRRFRLRLKNSKKRLWFLVYETEACRTALQEARDGSAMTTRKSSVKSKSSPRKRAPHPLTFVLGATLATTGIAAFVMGLFYGLGSMSQSKAKVLVPGESIITLEEGGKYTIFHEYTASFEGEMYRTSPGLDNLDIEMVHEETGALAVVETTRGTSTYSKGMGETRREAESAFKVDVPSAGRYQVFAWYPNERGTPKTVLSFSKSNGKRLAIGLVVANVGMFVLFGAGLGILIWRRTQLV